MLDGLTAPEELRVRALIVSVDRDAHGSYVRFKLTEDGELQTLRCKWDSDLNAAMQAVETGLHVTLHIKGGAISHIEPPEVSGDV
jgi:hypothetical protein